mmetsp:Transcript_91676/g.241855  ORF Transcript_91676/g.241855 Transcript_91676/m.241855 type:complete len:209 (-) Transcript_91676:715-1341(-)
MLRWRRRSLGWRSLGWRRLGTRARRPRASRAETRTQLRRQRRRVCGRRIRGLARPTRAAVVATRTGAASKSGRPKPKGGATGKTTATRRSRGPVGTTAARVLATTAAKALATTAANGLATTAAKGLAKGTGTASRRGRTRRRRPTEASGNLIGRKSLGRMRAMTDAATGEMLGPGGKAIGQRRKESDPGAPCELLPSPIGPRSRQRPG